MDAKTLGDMPVNASHGNMGEVVQTGITLRQHFAGLAMQGLLAGHDISASECAGLAVHFADELLAELAKESA